MTATIFRSEIDKNQLPPLCLCCGRPAEVFKDRVFSWHPWWFYGFLLLFVVPYFILRLVVSRRWRIRVPLCRRHRYHWTWSRVLFWSGCGIGVSLIGIGWQLETRSGPGSGVEWFLSGFWVLILLPWAYLLFCQSLVRPRAITADHITLEGVSTKFITALHEERVRRGEPPARRRCAGCGLESPLLTAFQRHGKRVYCPRCWERCHLREYKIMLLVELGIGVAGLLLLILSSMTPAAWGLRSGGWLLTNLFLMLAFEVLVVLPHEAGHALAAWLFRARVFAIWIGMGKTIFERRFKGVRLELKAIPLGGLTWVGHPDIRHYRLKHFLIILAGPLVNASILAALWSHVPARFWRAANLSDGFAPVLALFLANFICLGINLLPYRIYRDGLWLDFDGLALLTLPFASRAAIQQAHAGYFVLEGEECWKAKQYDRAAAWYERGLAYYPDDVTNRMNLGVVLAKGKQFGRARQEWLTLLGRADLDPEIRGLVLNNLAEANLWMDGPEGSDNVTHNLLEEADRFSAEALQSIPWVVHAKGTRGMVLIELGRIDEGMVFLQEAFQEHQNAEAKVDCACFLAIGEARRGRKEEARTYLEAARQLDPECLTLEKALKELADPRPLPELHVSEAKS